MERKIGERFDFLGIKLEVVEDKKESCDDCYFFGSYICGCECVKNFIGPCAYTEREDKKDVIFKEVHP